MPPGELALRTATAAILLVTGIILLRDRRRMESGPFGGLLALSVAIVSVAGVDPISRLWPMQILAMGTPALLWIWAGAVFDDAFRPSWRDAVAWAVLPVIAAVDLQARQPWIGTAESILALLFILAAAWRTLAGLRDDLHVFLRADQHGQPFTQDGVIVRDEHAPAGGSGGRGHPNSGAQRVRPLRRLRAPSAH